MSKRETHRVEDFVVLAVDRSMVGYRVAQSAVWAHPAILGSSIVVKDVLCRSF
jgi:hypothetical protein